MKEICFASAIDLARAVASGDLSCMEIISAHLERISERNPAVATYITVATEEALTAARDADARRARGELTGPLHGVPLSVKDLTMVGGLRCTLGSRVTREFVAPFDEALVARLRRAGAIVLGKTNTPELGTTVTTDNLVAPPTRNPWRLDRTSGGSSGGAAAALADGQCTLAEGSDGAGSIRIPAACCGVVGLKPSRGRVSMAPLLGEAYAGFATSGPMARTVEDAALMLDVMAGYETGDPYWAPPPAERFLVSTRRRPRGLKLALCTQVPGTATHPEVEAAVAERARLLQYLGHEVTVEMPPLGGMAEAFELVFAVSVAALPLDDLAGEAFAESELTPWVQWLRAKGRAARADEYVRALELLRLMARQLVAFFDDHDALLTPVLTRPAERLGWSAESFEETFAQWFAWFPFTYPFNVTGQPAIALPAGQSTDGLPIGLQIVGRPADEATVLALAATLEEAAPWDERRPPE